MPPLAETVKQAIIETLNNCDHGERTMTAKKLADLYGVSTATIYRHAARGGTKRKRVAGKPEYRDWTRTLVRLARQTPDGKTLPLDLALEAATASGQLPSHAADMPIATAYRLAREMELQAKPKRTQRLVADYPMQAIQIDGSSSEYLWVEAELDDGDYQLKLYHRPYTARGYKNKPLGAQRLRVLIYAAWDMCTGYTIARYVVAKGENALDAMDFLCHALEEKQGVEFHGVPDDIWSDQGPLFKSAAATDLLERLDINLVTGEPYNKTRMGGVERTHRTRWQRFERSLFLRASDTMTLSELNERLGEYERRENANRPARTMVGGRSVSRRDAWVALTNGRPADNRLRKLPADPIATMAREARRWVDTNGIIRWGGEYELARLHSCWVIARRAMDTSGNIICEDERTGDKHIAMPVTARRYGDIVGSPKTELEKLNQIDFPKVATDIYAVKNTNDQSSNLSRLPPRTSQAASLDNPLDADLYGSIEQAMRAFVKIFNQPLSNDNRALVIQRIIDAELHKDAVRQLALELAGLNTKQTTKGE